MVFQSRTLCTPGLPAPNSFGVPQPSRPKQPGQLSLSLPAAASVSRGFPTSSSLGTPRLYHPSNPQAWPSLPQGLLVPRSLHFKPFPTCGPSEASKAPLPTASTAPPATPHDTHQVSDSSIEPTKYRSSLQMVTFSSVRGKSWTASPTRRPATPVAAGMSWWPACPAY